jgi:hypothetical protein
MDAPAAVLLLALASASAWGVENTDWPPPRNVESRMHELQAAIRDPQSTMAQREAAREELAGLLKSPAGQARGRTADEKPVRPARAAIDPYPSVVKALPPIADTVPPPSGVAHLEVLAPPIAPFASPRPAPPAVPAQGFAIDPLTGHVLHPVPGGYVDPRTAQHFPR